jgi:hypothetical protein
MRRTRYRSEYRDGSYGFPQIAFIDQINQSIKPIGSQKFSSGATQSWLSTRHKTSDVMHLKTKRTKCTDRESPHIILHTQDEFRKIKPRDIETSVFRVGTSERLLENHSMSSFESRAHRSAADCLYYNTEYKVLICKEHGYAIAL